MMIQINNKDDIGFNFERARHCADTYANSVGVQCIIINTLGKTLYASSKNNELCGICKNCKNPQKTMELCSNSHLYGSYQAERFGGKYVFFCPMGLVHWASPITSNGLMKGALLGGPVQMVDPDDFLIEDIINKEIINETELSDLRKHLYSVPVIKPEIVNSMSEMLFITAAHVSDIQPSKYLSEREYHEQQADISEYIHYIKTMGGDEASLESYPLEKEKELLSLISIGDKSGSQKVLNEIFGHIFFSTGGNFEVIKARVLELIVLLSRAALEGGADIEQIFGLNYKYLVQINSFKTVEEITFWLSKIMTRFTDCVFNLTNVKHVDVIYRAVDYVKRNYMKKITLEEVASYVYLSPSYFSKIFKEEMGRNFNSYLNHIRIEMSKRLLMDDSVVLVDVSNIVGYEDQSYFSKVFKKLTGVSPGKYRESRGQAKSIMNSNAD